MGKKKKDTILGIDPGKKNCFFCLIEHTTKPLSKKLEKIPSTILSERIDMGDKLKIEEKLPLMLKSIKLVLKKTKPSLVVAERFVTRPRGGRGNVSEPVNMFLALLWNECRKKKIPLKLVMAGVWKGWFKRMYGEEAKKFFPKKKNVTEHHLDSKGMALYGSFKILGKTEMGVVHV